MDGGSLKNLVGKQMLAVYNHIYSYEEALR